MLGRSLGNYDVVSQIGEGGMGVVYLARHAMLGRAVAIKVLRSAPPNPDIVSRFFNEARAATAIRHPAIVEVYDVGFLEDRTAYIVMEYLEGESLATRIRRGRSTIETTLTIVRAIARALQAVHEHGIVHRDLKPDNVFLVPDLEAPGCDRVKLLDFGIAKLTERLGSIRQTATGTLLGTPIYMSPEQCRGDRRIDHRADLYSLGCVAYEMLCGQPPFTGDAPGDVIARHQYVEPAPLRWYRSDVPAGVDRLVMRLLEKRPDDRYRTAADVVRAIDHLGAASAVAAVDDRLPTLSMTMGATPTAATVSGTAPVAPRGGRGLGILVGAATATLALLVVLFILAGAVPGVVAGPSGLDAATRGAGSDERAGHGGRAPHERGIADRLVVDVARVLASLHRAANELRWRASLQAEAWVEHRFGGLLDPRGSGTFARLLRLIARARAVQDDVTAPLETVVTCLAMRRRPLGASASGVPRRAGG